MGVLSDLEPKRVFEIFEELCAIPHGSTHTKAISDWCVEFGKQLGLEHYQDTANNVILIAPATPGYENAPAVIMQGHLDMVCEKEPGCAKDMDTEGLDLFVEGDVVGARGTTLGSDDGIAVAMALAALEDKEMPHPRLEAVLTTEEDRIIPMNAGFMFRSINVVNLISKDCFIAQYQKTMGKTARNEKLTLVLSTQFYHYIFTESLAALSQVNSNIQHAALDDTHQLSLREFTFLIMQTSEHTTSRHRFIVLHKLHMPSNVSIKVSLLPCFKEIAASIIKYPRFYQPDSFNFCLCIFH